MVAEALLQSSLTSYIQESLARFILSDVGFGVAWVYCKTEESSRTSGLQTNKMQSQVPLFGEYDSRWFTPCYFCVPGINFSLADIWLVVSILSPDVIPC